MNTFKYLTRFYASMTSSILNQFQKKTISVQLIEEISKKDIMKFSDIKKCMVGKHDGTIGRELKKLVEDEIIIKTDNGYSLNHTHPEINDLLLWLNITPKDRKLHHVMYLVPDGYKNKGIDVIVSTDKSIGTKHLRSVFQNSNVRNALGDFYFELEKILNVEKMMHQIKDISDEEEREHYADTLYEEWMADKPSDLEIHIMPRVKRN